MIWGETVRHIKTMSVLQIRRWSHFWLRGVSWLLLSEKGVVLVPSCLGELNATLLQGRIHSNHCCHMTWHQWPCRSTTTISVYYNTRSCHYCIYKLFFFLYERQSLLPLHSVFFCLQIRTDRSQFNKKKANKHQTWNRSKILHATSKYLLGAWAQW